MINYINAELYRIAHKKSTYIYFGSLFLIYVLILTFTRVESAEIRAEDLTLLAFISIAILPIFFGIAAFLTVYNDEISAQTLGNVISTGLDKKLVPLAKIIISAIFLAVVFITAAIVFFGLAFFITDSAGSLNLQTIFGYAFIQYLLILGLFSIAGIFTYLFQKSSIAIVSISLLVLGVGTQILGLLSMISKNLSFIKDISITNQATAAGDLLTKTNVFDFKFVGVAAIYLVVCLVISAVIFNKNDVKVN